jgi:copper chaperone CopZ
MQNIIARKVPGLFLGTLMLFCCTVKAQFSEAKLQATGLTCALCSKAIHQALTQLPFVDSVRPELKTSSFFIRFKHEQPIRVRKIREAVEEAGFFVGGLYLKLSYEFSPAEESTRRFTVGDDMYQLLDEKRESGMMQVIEKGFLVEKDFKKMISRFGASLKDPGTVIYLLPQKK